MLIRDLKFKLLKIEKIQDIIVRWIYYTKFQEFSKISRNYDSENSSFQIVRIKKISKKKKYNNISGEQLGDCAKII